VNLPILPAKLTPPPLPASYVARERLDRLWTGWAEKRLLLVTAGAGFGKTSFLAARARELGDACLWYAIDETDRDQASFLAHLRALAESGTSRAIAQGARAPAAEDVPAVEVLALLVHALRARASRTLLVIDDLHLASSAPGMELFLERLIRFVPEEATLALASREPIGLGTARMRAQGHVAALAADDLKLTAAEVELLYRRHFPDAAHPARVYERIASRTEGWAAGIEIFLQNLEGDDSAAIDAALARVAAAKTGWFGYFAEEVLRRLDPATQDFLCRSSLLSRLDPALCDQVLEMRGSGVILETLRERHLFTFASGGHPPHYRYHQLFREFLLEQLRRKLPAAEISRLQRRAAQALTRAGAWVDALGAHVEGGDYPGALRLVERVGEGLLVSGQYHAVSEALAKIPADKRDRHASAQLVMGRLCDIQARWQEAKRHYEQALRLSTRGRQRADLMRLLGRLCCRWGRYAAGLDYARRGQAEPGARHWQTRAGILIQAGVASSELGRNDEAEALFTEGGRILGRHQDRFGEARALSLLAANVHRTRGEFQRGREALQQALVTLEKLGMRRQVCHAQCLLADLTLAAGDRREALDLASEGQRLAEALEYPSVEAYARQTLGRIALLEGDLGTARTHLELVLKTGEALEEQEFAVLPRLGLAEIALREGNRHAARRLALTACASATAAKTPWQLGRCHLLLGSFESSPGRAALHWRRAEALFRRIGAHYDLHHALLLRLAAGDVAGGRRVRLLRELLSGVARLGHKALLREIAPEEGMTVLIDALRLGIETEYVSSLLIGTGQQAIPRLRPLMTDPDPAARERIVGLISMIGGEQARGALAQAAARKGEGGRAAREALAVVAVGPQHPLKIRALGELDVLAGSLRLTHGGWRSARALRLFLLLLVHRFRWVPRDVVLETLWPDAEPEKAINNLRQSILVLRRTLEPDLPRNVESRYVRFRNEACRLEAGEGHEYDVERLEDVLREGERSWHAGQRARAKERYLEAMSLYQGDFLAESPYEEFVAAEREHLRDRMLPAIERLLELRAAAREWEELVLLSRRALTMDAYRESHYRHLVLAHLNLGHRREALSSYHEYEAMMIKELGLPPSERMRSLADRVIALGRASLDEN